ncbi:hypothetical protein [Sporolactobacillus putidus]|uniref:Uncharacterized protein n=1 Tax=Sporolactobacillus putidus TaxID=492735 RepID=A0A917S962_9BACL|nr:hypothetical protein [Sporolactobacillus putidus]GGL64743.1 hypothetical protein GCM10007968_30910 [Sporolactobacillus putidus]
MVSPAGEGFLLKREWFCRVPERMFLEQVTQAARKHLTLAMVRPVPLIRRCRLLVLANV